MIHFPEYGLFGWRINPPCGLQTATDRRPRVIPLVRMRRLDVG